MTRYAKLVKANGHIQLDLGAPELAYINAHYNQDTVYFKKDNQTAIYKKLISSKEVVWIK